MTTATKDKKRATKPAEPTKRQKALDDEWNNVPKPLQEKADDYYEAQQAQKKALGKKNSALEALKEAKKKYPDVKAVRIANGAKLIEFDDELTVHIKKIKEKPSANGKAE